MSPTTNVVRLFDPIRAPRALLSIPSIPFAPRLLMTKHMDLSVEDAAFRYQQQKKFGLIEEKRPVDGGSVSCSLHFTSECVEVTDGHGVG